MNNLGVHPSTFYQWRTQRKKILAIVERLEPGSIERLKAERSIQTLNEKIEEYEREVKIPEREKKAKEKEKGEQKLSFRPEETDKRARELVEKLRGGKDAS